MADITRRTQKKTAAWLEADEHLEVAVLCEPKGTYGLGMFKLALAPGAGQQSVNRAQRTQKEGQVGMVKDFPAEPCVVAVSATRFYAFPSNGLRFRRPSLVVDRNRVLVGEVSRKGFGRRMQLVFTDGSGIEVDVQYGQPIGKLIKALGSVAPIR